MMGKVSWKKQKWNSEMNGLRALKKALKWRKGDKTKHWTEIEGEPLEKDTPFLFISLSNSPL